MKKIILGHRGYSQVAPENTYLSFNLAYEFGFDGVEMDIHMTKDKKLVVIHDETIDRTSNGKGEVRNLTLDEIRKFDFSSHFLKDIPFQKILTFKEFLIFYGNKFKYINVEIKTDQIHYKGIEKMAWEIHQKIKPKAKIIYSSFNFNSLEILKNISQEAKTGFLFVDKSDFKGLEEKINKVCDYLHPWFKSVLNPEELEYYKSYKMPLNIWSLDVRNTGDKWTKGSFKNLDKLEDIQEINIIISNSRIS